MLFYSYKKPQTVKLILLFSCILFITISPIYSCKSKEHKTDLSIFEKTLIKAEQGDAKEQYKLGVIYANGREGVQQNYKLAFKWFSKSANQGWTKAQHSLGVMYCYGKGTTQNYKLAAKWVTKSAEQGDVNAQIFLATIYDLGECVSQDYKKAYAWCNIVSMQGDRNATKICNSIGEKLSPTELLEAKELSNNYYKKYVEPYQ